MQLLRKINEYNKLTFINHYLHSFFPQYHFLNLLILFPFRFSLITKCNNHNCKIIQRFFFHSSIDNAISNLPTTLMDIAHFLIFLLNYTNNFFI